MVVLSRLPQAVHGLVEMLGGLREITPPFLPRLGQVGSTQGEVIQGDVEKTTFNSLFRPFQRPNSPVSHVSVLPLIQ